MDLDYDLDAMNALRIRYLLAAAPVELSPASREQTDLEGYMPRLTTLYFSLSSPMAPSIRENTSSMNMLSHVT